MENGLRPGIRGEMTHQVETRHLASEVGSGLVSVFSTAMMIAGMEATAVESVQGLLAPGETTVGVHVDVAHKAATPPGMRVRFMSELLEVSANGKGLTFRVQAWDEAGVIGEGLHRRVVVDKEKFESRTRTKGDAAKAPGTDAK
ncbi:thioesterase family protein [Desulfovibrio sp.]|uniref:thioesterase family protein n=1 Tax=Desulfovibrio sp. TaxID=885 RepID=UPI0023CEFDF5|nr:thioesterase family protein [Desulfovibrio sp.]MDE7240430.1 thioesterase family protein [Desulfovibrio sp.]